MVTISLCMIVRDEEKNLTACLESLRGLMDEIIIVDTGSIDRTKEIARSFGANVYDFKWVGDFAAARNFAFSKATCDYIYSADADETIDADNIEEFKALKEALGEQEIPVDIVQMYYCGQLSGTEESVYNYDRELRPKLFKRIRDFIWQYPVHEQVRLEPVVFDSDIEIQHHQDGNHTARDLAIFESMISGCGDEEFSPSEIMPTALLNFYARELYKAGHACNYAAARSFFIDVTESPDSSVEDIQKASIILVRDARLHKDLAQLMKYALKDTCVSCTSETACELGDWYWEQGDPSEASLWYYNAVFELSPLLDIETGRTRPLKALVRCYEELGNADQAALYQRILDDNLQH